MPVEFVEVTAVFLTPFCDSDVGSAVDGDLVHVGGDVNLSTADFGFGGAVGDDDGLGGGVHGGLRGEKNLTQRHEGWKEQRRRKKEVRLVLRLGGWRLAIGVG